MTFGAQSWLIMATFGYWILIRTSPIEVEKSLVYPIPKRLQISSLSKPFVHSGQLRNCFDAWTKIKYYSLSKFQLDSKPKCWICRHFTQKWTKKNTEIFSQELTLQQTDSQLTTVPFKFKLSNIKLDAASCSSIQLGSLFQPSKWDIRLFNIFQFSGFWLFSANILKKSHRRIKYYIIVI